jgi:anti-anti-sigma factor
MEPAATTERVDHETAIVSINGPLRLSADIHDINTLLQQLIVGGITRLVLDLTDCPYVDSAGLGTLLHTYGLLTERQGHFRLCGVNQRIEDLIVMTHTDALLHRDPTRGDSLIALAGFN